MPKPRRHGGDDGPDESGSNGVTPVPPRRGRKGAQPVYRQARGGHRDLTARAVRQARRRRNRLAGFSVAAVVVVVAAVVAVGLTVGGSGSQYTPRTAADPGIVSHITTIPTAELASAVASDEESPTPLEPAYVLHSSLTSGGKPEVLFIGAEFCPVCATERWPMVVALSKFGSFSNLSQIRSANRDGHIATLDFYGSSYKSPYLTFVSVEAETNQPDGAGYKPLQTPSAAQESLWASTDAQAGLTDPSFPFLDIGGQYLLDTSQISDGSLSGLDWTQISGDIGNNSSTVGAGIDGSAGALVAYICAVTGNKPASVCADMAHANAPVTTLPTSGSNSPSG